MRRQRSSASCRCRSASSGWPATRWLPAASGRRRSRARGGSWCGPSCPPVPARRAESRGVTFEKAQNLEILRFSDCASVFQSRRHAPRRSSPPRARWPRSRLGPGRCSVSNIFSAVEFRFRLGIHAAVGQQPAQFLTPDRLVELVLDLPAQRDAAARSALAARRAPMGTARDATSPKPMARLFLLPCSRDAFCAQIRHGAAGLAAEAVGVRQRVQRPGLGAFVFQTRRAVFAVGEQRAQQVDDQLVGAELVVERVVKRSRKSVHALSNCPARTVW